MTWHLHTLAKSRTDAPLAGVCGGLGEHTPVPAWIWRILFCVATLFNGAGAVAYLLLWLFMPAPGTVPAAHG